MNPPGGPDPTRTIIFLAIGCFASAASLRACDPILPEIASSFGTTPGGAAYIVSFFGIAYGFAQFGYGFAGDRFGKLRVIVTATFLSAATAAYMFHNTLQVNATQMEPEARGIPLGLFAICMFLGQAIGVAVAAPVFDNTGPPIFLAAALFLVILSFVYRVQARRHAQDTDTALQ